MIDVQQLANAIVDAIRTAVGLPKGDGFTAITRATKVTNVRVAVAAPNEFRRKFMYENTSAVDHEIGGRDLVFGQGILVTAGSAYIDDTNPYLGEWYAIAATAGPYDARVRDES